jgi:hypothetical protein
VVEAAVAEDVAGAGAEAVAEAEVVAEDVVAVKGMMTRMRIERQDVTTSCAPV